MNCLSAFSFFETSKKEGNEGVFFSVKKPGVIQKDQWIFGWGKKQVADFEKGPFPFFSITDFLGKENQFWYFENWVSSENIDIDLRLQQEIDLESVYLKKNKKFEKLFSETEETFSQKILEVQKGQRDGEFWVLNLAQDLKGVFNGKEEEGNDILLGSFYRFLKSGKGHCGGVVLTSKQKFCSFSPEVFLLQKGLNVSTFPIKGTGTELELKDSIKEISELSMVTDLLRNDFGQICEKVWVERERFLTNENDFYHAQSEIRGVLKLVNEKGLSLKAFKKLFPTGSISGAPKKRVTEKIVELENFDRGFYTGIFGVRFSEEESIFSILIRTLFIQEHFWHFPVGAGITIDSNPKKEFQETLMKMKVLEEFSFKK